MVCGPLVFGPWSRANGGIPPDDSCVFPCSLHGPYPLSHSCILIIREQVKRFSESRDLISLANAFSGGVFLSLAFGHMIPHSTHGFEKLVRPLRHIIHKRPFVTS